MREGRRDQLPPMERAEMPLTRRKSQREHDGASGDDHGESDCLSDSHSHDDVPVYPSSCSASCTSYGQDSASGHDSEYDSHNRNASRHRRRATSPRRGSRPRSRDSSPTANSMPARRTWGLSWFSFMARWRREPSWRGECNRSGSSASYSESDEGNQRTSGSDDGGGHHTAYRARRSRHLPRLGAANDSRSDSAGSRNGTNRSGRRESGRSESGRSESGSHASSATDGTGRGDSAASYSEGEDGSANEMGSADERDFPAHRPGHNSRPGGRALSRGTECSPDRRRGTATYQRSISPSQSDGSGSDSETRSVEYEQSTPFSASAPLRGQHYGNSHTSNVRRPRSAHVPHSRWGACGTSNIASTCSSAASSSTEMEVIGSQRVRRPDSEVHRRPLTPQHWQSSWQPQRHCAPSRTASVPNIANTRTTEVAASAMGPSDSGFNHRSDQADMVKPTCLAVVEAHNESGPMGSLLSHFWSAHKVTGDSELSCLETWDVEAVCKWLRIIGLAEYADDFRLNHIDGRALALLGRDDLAEVGVRSVGHRLTILRARAQVMATVSSR